MNCTRFATAKAASAPSFGAREGAAGMALGLLLLCTGMSNVDFGIKWDYGCHCGGGRAALAAPLRASALGDIGLSRSYHSTLSGNGALGAPLANSPLPVASDDMRGAQVGAEPEARLGNLSAFPSADPYQTAEAAVVSAPAPAPAPSSSYSSAFSQAAGLDGGDDELVPMRKRR